MVVSEKGESLSPNTAPEMTAPAAMGRGAPVAMATPITATPAVPAEPKEVPVKVEMMAQTKNPVTNKNRGLISLIP